MKMHTRAKRRRQDEEEEAKYPPHERERKARIARAKAELMTLTVKELKKELKLFANPKVYTGQYSAMGESSPQWDRSYDRRPYWHYFPPKYPVPQKGDMADWLANYKWLREGSPFDLLPDELLLKIVKLATSDHDFNHDFNLMCISRVSVRFYRISRDISLRRHQK